MSTGKESAQNKARLKYLTNVDDEVQAVKASHQLNPSPDFDLYSFETSVKFMLGDIQ